MLGDSLSSCSVRDSSLALSGICGCPDLEDARSRWLVSLWNLGSGNPSPASPVVGRNKWFWSLAFHLACSQVKEGKSASLAKTVNGDGPQTHSFCETEWWPLHACAWIWHSYFWRCKSNPGDQRVKCKQPYQGWPSTQVAGGARAGLEGLMWPLFHNLWLCAQWDDELLPLRNQSQIR